MQLTFDNLWQPPAPPPPPDDDESFWGRGGKRKFLERIRFEHQNAIKKLASLHGWDLDGEFNPLPPIRSFSMAELVKENKVLMAHVVHEMGIFPSVKQARKNGWDRPLELGDFSVTKKKIRFRIVE